MENKYPRGQTNWFYPKASVENLALTDSSELSDNISCFNEASCCVKSIQFIRRTQLFNIFCQILGSEYANYKYLGKYHINHLNHVIFHVKITEHLSKRRNRKHLVEICDKLTFVAISFSGKSQS